MQIATNLLAEMQKCRRWRQLRVLAGNALKCCTQRQLCGEVPGDTGPGKVGIGAKSQVTLGLERVAGGREEKERKGGLITLNLKNPSPNLVGWELCPVIYLELGPNTAIPFRKPHIAGI